MSADEIEPWLDTYTHLYLRSRGPMREVYYELATDALIKWRANKPKDFFLVCWGVSETKALEGWQFQPWGSRIDYVRRPKALWAL